MDSVEIRGLSCRCIIGIRARERRVAQRVRLDVELSLDLAQAGRSGRIAHTVDYSRVSAELSALLRFRCYSLLEVAAEECAAWLFASHGAVRAVELRIQKPQALAGQAESGGVRVRRERPPAGERQRTSFGFTEPYLETSEAMVAVVGLDGGATLSPSDLGAESALVLPLAAGLASKSALQSHALAQLEAGQPCTNRDVSSVLLVVCARRGTSG